MGLDQFAYKVKKEDMVDDVTIKEDAELVEIFSWRKHPNLHWWMERLYEDTIGQSIDSGHFNCIPVRIYEEDLDELEKDILTGALPERTGFLFGESGDYHDKETLRFIEEARQVIKDGFAVYYDSWW